MTQDPVQALSSVRSALSRVVEVDPAVMRPDTPLAELGCDAVAMVAIVDLLAGDVADDDLDALEALVASASTVGDLLEVVGWAGGR